MPPPDDRTAASPAAPAAADATASLGHTGPELAPAQAPADVPDRLGKYRVVGVLGRGGMGVVYRAEDPVLRRTVALKVLPAAAAANPLARERFLREARAQAAVEHDHVVPIYDVVDDSEVPFLAMPVLRGLTLADALRANPRPPLAETVRIAREAAEGLAAAHAIGLVHRDIKPGNIWLEEGRLRVKLLDFGLARAAGDADPAATHVESAADAPAHLTATGAILGTPAYMSPEQALGRPLDHRTDLFSLGVVLYQMLAGRPPFPGRTVLELMTAVVGAEPVPLADVVPDLPPALSDLVARLLAKHPAGRPPSAAAVAAELGAIGATLTGVALPAAEPWGDLGDDAPTLTAALAPVRRPRGRRWAPVALAGAGLLVVAAAVAGVLYVRAAGNDGVLEIDAGGAEDVALTVTRDGVPVAERTLDRKLTLPAGRYAVEPSDPDPAVKVSPAVVTLDAGGRAALTVRVDKRAVTARKLDDFAPDDPEWLKLFLKQPPRVQVARVSAELNRLNPDFDGKVDYTDEAGKVVSLTLKTDHVSDIGPLRVLRELKSLSAVGSRPGSGRLADIAPLRGLRLTSLTFMWNGVLLRNTDALRGMPLATLWGYHVPRATDVEPLRGMSLRELQLGATEPLDFALLKDCLAERALLQVSPSKNLAGLGTHSLYELQTPPELFDDPAAADVRIETLYVSGPPEVLAARGRHLRRNPHLKMIQRTPPAVFWSYYDLSPRQLAPVWHVLGPCKPNDEDPVDPTNDGGRLSPEFLAAPVRRGGDSPLLWKQVAPGAQGQVDFGAVTGRDKTAVAWLHALVRVDEPGRGVLFVAGGVTYRVWLNGGQVMLNPSGTWHDARQAVVVNLLAGENHVIVRSGIGADAGYGDLTFHLHRLRPGEAPPAGIDPPPPPPKP